MRRRWRCWLGHDWGEWLQVEVKMYDLGLKDPAKFYVVRRQRRFCASCGLRQGRP